MLEPGGYRVVRAGILRIHVRRTDDDFGTERLEGVDFLFGLLVGRGENAVIALDHRGDGEAHSGIPGRPLDDRPSRLQVTGALRIFDHADRHTILERVARVERLELGQDRRVDDTARDAVDPDHRRVADHVQDRSGDRTQAHAAAPGW